MNTEYKNIKHIGLGDDPDFFVGGDPLLIMGYNIDGHGSVLVTVNGESLAISWDDYVFLKYGERIIPQEYSPRIAQKAKRQFDKVPTELKEYPQWRCARWSETLVGQTLQKTLHFLKHDGDSYTWDITDDPATNLLSYDQAVEAYARWNFDILLFVITRDDPFAAVSITKANPSDKWVYSNKIVNKLNSYTELNILQYSTPCLLTIVKANLGEDRIEKGNTLIVGHGAAMPITGHHVRGTPGTIECRQKELETLCAKFY